MPDIFLQSLTLFSLFRIIARRAGYRRIYYFGMGKFAFRLSGYLAKAGVLKAVPEELKFHFGELRTRNGETVFIKHAEDLTMISGQIRDNVVAKNRFLLNSFRYFSCEKVLLFFEKVISSELSDLLVFINAAAVNENKAGRGSGEAGHFFFETRIGNEHIEEYIRSLGMVPVVCKAMPFSGVKAVFNKISAQFAVRLNGRTSRLFKKNKSAPIGAKPGKNKGEPEFPGSSIVGFYSGRSLNFDLGKRSEFFWMLRSGIARGKIGLLLNRTDVLLKGEQLLDLKEKGIETIALAPLKTIDGRNVPVWKPGLSYKKMRRRYLFRLVSDFIFNLAMLRQSGIFYLVHMFYFADKFSFWSDFFGSSPVKVVINCSDFAKPYIPMSSALEKAGGISISYHWSNLCFNNIVLSNCSDIVFSFGPYYRKYFESNRSVLKYLIYGGYITDHAFQAVRADSRKLREGLLSRGAKFVIAYFDENSADDRMCSYPTSRAIEVYSRFLAYLMENPNVGMIFKPGYPRTIHSRLAPIREVIEKAKATGRCVFIDQGNYLSEVLPTELAQASDLSVGHLASGTVALESFLSGTITIFLDLEKVYSSPVYPEGRGRVVFDELEPMLKAIDSYRSERTAIPGFGDLTDWAKGKDAFKDGNASLRFGSYVKWLDEALVHGKSRDDAMEYANRMYTDSWGRESIVKWH